MPPQKCSVAIYTRSGRSTDYKVLVCRREVAVAGYGPLSVLSLAGCRLGNWKMAYGDCIEWPDIGCELILSGKDRAHPMFKDVLPEVV
jgi:hypothetical protein